AARRRDNHLEVAHDLLVLGYQVARRGNVPLGVAARLPGQEEQSPARRYDAVTEAGGPRQRWRVDDVFSHTSSLLFLKSFYHVCPAHAHMSRSAHFSPIIIQVMHGLTLIIAGKIDASAILKPF